MLFRSFRVGVYIDDEFNEFATCTTHDNAIKAKKLLEQAGWGDEDDEEETVVIEKSNLYLDSLEIDGKEIDVTHLDINMKG